MISSILLITLFVGCKDAFIYKTSPQFNCGDKVAIIPNEFEQPASFKGVGIVKETYEYYHERYYVIMAQDGFTRTYESDRLELVERMDWAPIPIKEVTK